MRLSCNKIVQSLISIDTNTSLNTLQEFLESKNWLNANENIISISKPGEGNMNVVLRVITNQRSFILNNRAPMYKSTSKLKPLLTGLRWSISFMRLCKELT